MGVADAEGVARLLDVLRRRAPVHPAAVLGTGELGEGGDERDHDVAGRLLVGEQRLVVDVRHVGVSRDGRRRLGRHDAGVRLRLRERRLHLQPPLPPCPAGEQGAHGAVG